MNSFQDYLMQRHIKEDNPLDDQLPDSFNEWMCDLDPERWIFLAEDYFIGKLKTIDEAIHSRLVGKEQK